MKQFGYTASVLKDSNVVVAHSDADWSALAERSSFRFNKDNIFYGVGRTEQFLFIKEFNSSGNILTVNDDTGINIGLGDTLTVSYKEFELGTVLSILDKGKGYRVGDNVTVKGGIPTKSVVDGSVSTIKLSVTKIGVNGDIEELSCENRGRYLKFPDLSISIFGGSGFGAKLKLDPRAVSERALTERTVLNIEKKDGKTIFTLDYPLPESVGEGKASVTKWRALLTSNYVGDTKISETYQVLRDLTPFAGIPLLLKNSAAPELIFNESMSVIDKKIKALQDEINSLKLRLGQ